MTEERRPAAPPSRSVGAHCTSLRVVLRVSALNDGPYSGDHEATWLLGHTERIEFGRMWRQAGDLLAEAELRVPCRFLHREGPGADRCRAHGSSRILPAETVPRPEARRVGGA